LELLHTLSHKEHVLVNRTACHRQLQYKVQRYVIELI
jgi:hypothetical protein